jgi:hypothetical protein
MKAADDHPPHKQTSNDERRESDLQIGAPSAALDQSFPGESEALDAPGST